MRALILALAGVIGLAASPAAAVDDDDVPSTAAAQLYNERVEALRPCLAIQSHLPGIYLELAENRGVDTGIWRAVIQLRQCADAIEILKTRRETERFAQDMLGQFEDALTGRSFDMRKKIDAIRQRILDRAAE